MFVFDRCGIALDAWMLPVSADIYQNSIQQPLLFINSEKFQWSDNILKMKKLISNDTNKKMITIKYVSGITNLCEDESLLSESCSVMGSCQKIVH